MVANFSNVNGQHSKEKKESVLKILKLLSLGQAARMGSVLWADRQKKQAVVVVVVVVWVVKQEDLQIWKPMSCLACGGFGFGFVFCLFYYNFLTVFFSHLFSVWVLGFFQVCVLFQPFSLNHFLWPLILLCFMLVFPFNEKQRVAYHPFCLVNLEDEEYI